MNKLRKLFLKSWTEEARDKNQLQSMLARRLIAKKKKEFYQHTLQTQAEKINKKKVFQFINNLTGIAKNE